MMYRAHLLIALTAASLTACDGMITSSGDDTDLAEASRHCGNGICGRHETPENCPADCAPEPVCGDGACDPGEDCASCADDCGPCDTSSCGDATCDPDESCSSCPADCGTCPTGGCALPGYPDASCTGVPAGTALTAYTGPWNITTPNTVIDGKSIDGTIAVSASGVVIRNSRIVGGVYVDDRGWPGGTPLLVEDTEIDCGGAGGTGVGEAHFTMRRVDVHGCENGFDINQDVLIEDSYIHDLFQDEVAHSDGAQLASGHWTGSAYACCALDVTFRHNTIYGMGVGDVFGTSAIISNRGGDVNILIEDNLLAGGAYTLYCEQGTRGTNYRVLDNHFSTKFKSSVGYYGASTDCSDETQSGNVIHETGQPLTLE
jgi:hypothetical protein